MIQYEYVENEKIHTLFSTDTEIIFTCLKDHWDNTTNIPYQLIRPGRNTINMGGLENLKSVRTYFKSAPHPNIHPRFYL